METIVFAGLVGMVVGSFLNVVIARVPVHFASPRPTVWGLLVSLSTPGSSCCHCRRRLVWWENIPLVSYVMLGGKCRTCRGGIAVRYLIVEVFVALEYIALALLGRWGIGSAIWVAAITALAFLDLESRTLPDLVTLPLLGLGLARSLGGGQVHFPEAAVAALAAYLYFYLVAMLSKMLAGRAALGGGDAKLVAALGAWLGLVPIALVVAAASIASLLILVVAPRYLVAGRLRPFPFGAVLCVASALCYLLLPYRFHLPYVDF
ncbi:prepilin peptidase [Burkholderia cenocepacia]|uniref:prepilin peptidase n=1 Tax=Burkholderia cenocepacia TaxID=95486 RepID=UPI002AB2D739|nr:prepilin peptidase [Burkholderia cenocepacia]